MKLIFTIQGNQQDEEGNAIPKVKLTKGQQWSAAAQRYASWKAYVREQALLHATEHGWPQWTIRRLAMDKKLFDEKEVVEAQMHLSIVWANETHGDPEGIFGSIADALFGQDKHLAGSFDFVHGQAGSVVVQLEVKLISEQ